ncbi:MAG TPA: contractile injection system protein, VgrG/Pvc8 family, partial [Devosia sp.]|nr:contractile injection system protein, VgrG/Pvc8 family [Devosia sp.]
MVDSFTQDTRLGELLTPIGTNALVLTTFTGDEWISAPFRFEVSAISVDNNAIDFDKALGENITLRITSINGEERYFTGTLTEAIYTGPLNDGHFYNLVLRPWFWLLSKQSRSQVFHNMTVKDIVAKVFGDHG